MTPDELDAIRERDVDCVPAGYTSAQAARDRRALLAEVDRLTATPYPEDDIKAERARILATVEALPEPTYTGDTWTCDASHGWGVALAFVIAAIKGETP